MFATSTPSRSASSLLLSGLYRQVGVETGVASASPHQLVQMLFDGLLESLVHARAALREHQVEAKGRAITRASRILDEGLKAALSPAGGELSQNLDSLYGYVAMRLMQAHLHNDDTALAECQRLIQPVRDAWAEIGAQVQA